MWSAPHTLRSGVAGHPPLLSILARRDAGIAWHADHGQMRGFPLAPRFSLISGTSDRIAQGSGLTCSMTHASGWMSDESRVMTDDLRVLVDDSRAMMDEAPVMTGELRFMSDELQLMSDESRFMSDEARVMIHEFRFMMNESRFMPD